MATSGPGVLEAAPTANPDVVVLKQFLAKLNGSAVATLLRMMPSTKSIPIVLYDTVSAGATAMPGAAGNTPVNDCVMMEDPLQILDAIERALGLSV
jgi:CheY-like chemotaxis protein